MSSFWLILKQQWTIEENSIFSNRSHLEWRVGLTDTILKGDHPRTIPAKFVLIWLSGFRGEDLNVIFYQNMPNLHNRLKEKFHRKTWNKIRFYCPIKVPARGRVITVIYITKNILINKCNKQYTSNLQKLDWYISTKHIYVSGVSDKLILVKYIRMGQYFY